MLKALKWLVLLLILTVVVIAAWGYAPDRDPEELRKAYGGPPSVMLPLPDGQKVHLRDEGPRQAPVLLLLHGSSSSLHTWQGWADDLKRDYRVIRYDQPGHGLTGPQVKDDYSAKSFSDTAAAVMEQLGIDRYVVVGNSMGGWVAWNHALAYPDRVSGLVLVDAAGAPDSAPTNLPLGFRLAQSEWVGPMLQYFTPRTLVARSVRQTVANPDAVSDAQIDRYWNLLLYPGNRHATRLRNKVPRVPATAAQMAGITAPALVMWGAKDTLIPVSAADWFADNLPQSSRTIYPDLGHIPMEEAPERTVQDLRQWLSDVGLNQPTGPASDGAASQTAPAGDSASE
ncbi:MAG: alpha/beta hydrolase [Blastomonas sp.]